MNRASKIRLRAIILKYRFIYRQLNVSGVSFTSKGFKHLVYSASKRRTAKEIRHRMSFIPQIPKILAACPIPIEIRGEKELNGEQVLPVCYCAFEAKTPDGKVRLVTRQIYNEKPCFYSLIEIRQVLRLQQINPRQVIFVIVQQLQHIFCRLFTVCFVVTHIGAFVASFEPVQSYPFLLYSII